MPECKRVTTVHINNAVTQDVNFITEYSDEYSRPVFTVDKGNATVYQVVESLSELTVCDECVIHLLLNLDAKKSAGPHPTPNAFLR